LRTWLLSLALFTLLVGGVAMPALAQAPAPMAETKEEEKKDPVKEADTKASDALVKGDSAWMMVATAFVMLMVPGLALFYGGMVRRKNILATMMQSMVCLSVVGVYWMAVGYSLAFGEPWISLGDDKGSVLGFSEKLLFLRGVGPTELLNGTNIPVYLHMLYQGMFCIITPALISGAIAERIRFGTYLTFVLLWVTFVYCPLAHMVWAMNWWTGDGLGAVGYLGKMGALDFAGGTVVHIAAGFSSLAAILVLRKRLGYPEQTIHPSSMVLCLTGAGLLWFGWFGFNGGSGLLSGTLGVSAFAATQGAAAAAGLSWMLLEWAQRGKPTALGLASGIVAGLVAVTPASGFVSPSSGMLIGLLAGIFCYVAVMLKPSLGYDDSLDAFGVHGIGGFLGAVLTGVFCSRDFNAAVPQDYTVAKQVTIQLIAAGVAAGLALVGSLVLVKLCDVLFGFATDEESEVLGLDRTEHNETGFDFGLAMESASVAATAEPRAAVVPGGGGKRFHVVVEGAKNGDLIQTWSDLCKPGDPPAEFKAVYPYVTTVQGNRFTFRGGDPETMRNNIQKLFQTRLSGAIKTRVEAS
jgi:ammonium transporter